MNEPVNVAAPNWACPWCGRRYREDLDAARACAALGPADDFGDLPDRVAATALADHRAHLTAIARQRDAVIDGIKRSDRRRKNWDFPATRVVSAQTLVTCIGTLPDGTVAEVRRLDAMPAAEIDGLFDVTVPPAVTVADLAASRAIGEIAGPCMAGGA